MKKWVLPMVLGSILVVMAVAQLTSFETVVKQVTTYTNFTGLWANVLVIIVISLEVLALPSLFYLNTNNLAKSVSRMAVIMAPLMWLALIAVSITANAMVNSALFGEYVDLPLSVAIVFTLLLIILAFICLQGLGVVKLAKPKSSVSAKK